MSKIYIAIQNHSDKGCSPVGFSTCEDKAKCLAGPDGQIWHEIVPSGGIEPETLYIYPLLERQGESILRKGWASCTAESVVIAERLYQFARLGIPVEKQNEHPALAIHKV